MADLTLDQLKEGKPVLIEKDGKSICVARVGAVSRSNAGCMAPNLIFAPEKP